MNIIPSVEDYLGGTIETTSPETGRALVYYYSGGYGYEDIPTLWDRVKVRLWQVATVVACFTWMGVLLVGAFYLKIYQTSLAIQWGLGAQ